MIPRLARHSTSGFHYCTALTELFSNRQFTTPDLVVRASRAGYCGATFFPQAGKNPPCRGGESFTQAGARDRSRYPNFFRMGRELKLKRRVGILTVLAVLGFGSMTGTVFLTESSAANPVARKKLIEFGWDEPDTAFMRRHVAEMERTPFDGCVFHINYSEPDGQTGNFTWEAWGRRSFTERDLRSAADDLKATHFRRFRNNFLRFNVTPADIDWFDDFSAVLQNARLAARVARVGKSKGILLDVEQYKAHLFNYREQKDAGSRSWQEYADQARRRGHAVMEAFQEGFPNLTVFLTFGYELPWQLSQEGQKQLADSEYGLLAPFLDGMVEAAAGRARIVDGYEFAYYFHDPAEFSVAYRKSKDDILRIVADPKKYLRVFVFSFGIWMDGVWPQRGWHTDDLSRNFHSPGEFEALVREALGVADEYVWIYSEKPRWWSEPSGNSVSLPEEYRSSLIRGKQTYKRLGN